MTEQPNSKITTIPAISDVAGMGVDRGIVPAPTMSSSDHGPLAANEAGVARELATAANNLAGEEGFSSPCNEGFPPPCEEGFPSPHEVPTTIVDDEYVSDRPRTEDATSVEVVPPPKRSPNIDPPSESRSLINIIEEEESRSWINMIEEAEQAAVAAPPCDPCTMDIEEERIAFKRKKCRVIDTDSLEDSASDAKNGKAPAKATAKATRKRATRSCTQTSSVEGQEDPGCSSPDNEPLAGGKRKVVRPRRKVRAIDPIIAEQQIIRQTGKVPDEYGAELLSNMTVSDISALALEFIEAIETIRTKCGRLQSGLSGELKKRTQGLAGFIRALQERAENMGDPHILQHKIDELLHEMKEHKKEEERRKREIGELQDTIKELRQENKNIRLEFRRSLQEVRNKVGKDENKYVQDVHVSKNKDDKYLHDDDYVHDVNESSKDRYLHNVQETRRKKNVYNVNSVQKEDHIHNVNNVQREEHIYNAGKDSETTHPREAPTTEWVYRPALQGKQFAIPIRKDKGIPSVIFSNKSDDNTNSKPKSKRTDIKVISNVQVKPPMKESRIEKPLAEPQQVPPPKDNQWTTVGKDGKALRKKKGQASKNATLKDKIAPRIERKRLPKTAAVSLKGTGSNFSYAEALKKIRTEISLKDLDIQMPKIRRGISGNAIIEINGPDNSIKADRLAQEVQRVLGDVAQVSRPNINGEIRLTGMDVSISKEEIVEAVAIMGNCKPNEIRAGKIGRTRGGAGVIWIQCPKTAAVLLAEKKKIPIGWSTVKVEALKKRPIQCHRCWQVGHVRANCRSNKDRTSCCFRCGRTGHSVSSCKNQVRCIICFELNREHSHRMGSVKCTCVTDPPTSSEKLAPKKIEMMSANTSQDQPISMEVSNLPDEVEFPTRTDSPERRTDEVTMEEL